MKQTLVISVYKRIIDYLIESINNFSVKQSLLLIVLLNVAIYLPLILFLPNHLLDDYVIFGTISSTPDNIISLNPSDPYFLFLRPISYLTFWIDFNLWPMKPMVMKIINLFFHLALVSMLYLLILELKKIFFLKPSNTIAITIVFLFSFHPDNLRWIIWIANRTELLMICFYILGLYFYFKFINDHRNIILTISFSLIFFMLSITSKQQSLHFPLLILFITLLNRRNISLEKKKVIYVVTFIGAIVVLAFSLLNSILYHEQSYIFFANLWKKFFSLPGLMVYIINPLVGDYIYNYFLLNKIYSLFLLVPALITVYYFIKKYSFKTIIIIFLGYLIISFPRMIAHSGPRINSIQILFFALLIGVVLILIKRKILYIFIVIILSLNFINLGIFFHFEKVYHSFYEKRVAELNKIYSDSSYILLTKDPLVLQYHMYYFKSGNYGITNLNIIPIQYWELTFLEFSKIYKKVDIKLEKEKLFLKTNAANMILTVNPSETPKFIFKPDALETKNDKTDRGFSEISFKILPEMKGKKLIYFNGKDWEKVKSN